MLVQAVRISSSHFGYFGCIVDDRPRLLRLAVEPAILERRGGNQVDSVTQQPLQRGLKLLTARQPRPEVVVRRLFDEKVDIATLGIEIESTDGAEDLQPGHPEVSGECADGVPVALNQWMHVVPP